MVAKKLIKCVHIIVRTVTGMTLKTIKYICLIEVSSIGFCQKQIATIVIVGNANSK